MSTPTVVSIGPRRARPGHARSWLAAPWPRVLLLAALLPATTVAVARPAAGDAPTAVIEVHQADLAPQHWIAQLPDPDRVILDRAAIAAQNARMRAEDRSIHDIATLPDPLPRAFVRERIEALSAPPTRPCSTSTASRCRGSSWTRCRRRWRWTRSRPRARCATAWS